LNSFAIALAIVAKVSLFNISDKDFQAIIKVGITAAMVVNTVDRRSHAVVSGSDSVSQALYSIEIALDTDIIALAVLTIF
jgi:hypothetical protein